MCIVHFRRGAIRRLSIRDRAGVTLARLEARREAALMRSWSFEDTSMKPSDVRQFFSRSLIPNYENACDFLSQGQDDAGEVKKTESDSAITTRNGGGSVQLVGGKSLGAFDLALPVDSQSRRNDSSKMANDSESAHDASASNQQQKLHKIQNDERKPKQGSTKRRSKKSSSSAEPSSTSSSGPESASSALGNGSAKGTGAGAQPSGTSEDNQVAFSRHALTLSDLKKQRSEDRKSSGTSGTTENRPAAATTPLDGSDIRARFRSPSDAVVGSQSSQSRAPRRKMGLKCCTIT